VSHTSWISIAGGSTGSGNGVVTFSVIPNPGPQRQGLVTVAGYTHTVTQQAADAPSCSYTISSSQFSAPAAGASAAVAVVAPPGCAWTVTSQSSWITVTSGPGGNGNGTINLSIAPNNGVQRSGVVTMAGHTYTVTQSAGSSAPGPGPGPCTYSLGSADASVAAAGGTVQVAVTSGAGCDWTAVSQASWITITGGASGTGNGTVRLSVSANGGSQRAGTVTIGGETFTVTQSAAAACTYSISPTTQQVGALGGDFSVSITTQAGCSWTAVSQDGWIQITSNTSGTGNGLVSYRIALGLLFSRSGRITITGGNTLTVNQAAVLLSSAR
jgi:hypothetical protein